MNLLHILAMNFLRNRGTQAPAMGSSPNYLGLAKGMLGTGSKLSAAASGMATQNSIQSGIAAGADVGMGAAGAGGLGTFASGMGAAAAFPMAGYAAARMALPAISKSIFGEGKKVWEYTTPELMSGNLGDYRHNPMINAVLRSRGVPVQKSTSKDLQIFNMRHTGVNLPWEYDLKDQSTLEGYNQLSNLYSQGANA